MTQGQTQTATTSFYRTISQNTSRIEQSKLGVMPNSYVSFMTDVDQRDQQVKPDIQLPETIFTIISKKQSERNSSQNGVILRYLIKKSIFKFLCQKLTTDLVKNMIKNGNLRLYDHGQIFIHEGRKVKNVDILLIGKAFIISHDEKQNSENENIEDKDTFGDRMQKLIDKIGRQTKKFKIKHQVSNKKIGQLQKSILFRKQYTIDDYNIDQCEIIEAQNFLDFQPLFQYEPKHSHSIAAKDTIVVFTLPLQIFYETMLHHYHNKLNQKLKLFRKISVFDPFQNSKLKLLVQKLSIIEMKKNEFVYRQGEQPKCFYMLIEGEIQISKTIDIFNQNPNNLYKNRIQVSRQRMNHQLKILPYANFNGVYNFIPEKKMITLAQINPICIFGEQQIINKKQRQVNAKILSLTAHLYQIYLQDIQDLCNKMIGSNGEKKMTLVDFLLMMQNNITLKKILFRQNQLSDLIQYQNKNKYSTLFDDNNNNKKRSKSFRKSTPITKFIPDQNNGRNSDRKNIQKSFQQAPPQFNNFNFTDFLNDQNQSFLSPVSQQLNEQQLKVVKLTHVKFSDSKPFKGKQKSIRLRNLSRQAISKSKISLDNFATIDSVSTKITLDQPLFTINYFQKQQKDEKKLYVQAKKKRLENIYKNSPQKINKY